MRGTMRPMFIIPVIQAVTKSFRVVSSRGALTPRVYILELAQGRVYVGQSVDVDRRFAQHANGTGAAFTRAFAPTGNRLHRMGDVQGFGDAAERDETLRYMFLRGINNVRGWRYCTLELSRRDQEDAEANIRELYDLCRRCGNASHLMRQCKFKFDRLGRDMHLKENTPLPPCREQ